MILLSVLACGERAPERATEPHSAATEAVVSAVCNLVKGAGHACAERTRQVVIDEAQPVTVEVYVDEEDDTLGQITLRGRVRLVSGEQAVWSRFDQSGWGASDAYDRAVHMWAVIVGAPLVDWLLRDPSRPALAALHRQTAGWVPPVPPPVGEFRALQGWTFQQAVTAELDHPALLAPLEGPLGALAAGEPHVVDVRISSDLGEQVFDCYVGAEPSPSVCEAAPKGPWPAGVGWALRQAYVLVPKGALPPAPPRPPDPGTQAGTDGGAESSE